MPSDLAAAFLRWTGLRAALARGYWLAAALYLVVVARLTPTQLILIGTFQGITVLIAEIPSGVLADVVSRRLCLVVGHLVMGSGMALAGLVTSFPLLVASQCLWGLGWAFSSGADVAWLTDELDRPDIIDRVLVAQGRWDLTGTAVGLVTLGGLAWATTLSTAIVVAGAAMGALGIATVARWPETRLPARERSHAWWEARSILRGGLRLARVDRVILGVIVATVFVNGGGEAYGRLLDRQLVVIGLPRHPALIFWFAALSLVGVALGALALRLVEARVTAPGVIKRTYVVSCSIGAAGLLLFAAAPDVVTAVAGALLVSGIALPINRTAAIIWVNRRTTAAVRATVHSLVSQAEQAGEILFGLTLAGLAAATSAKVALMASAALLACAAAVAAATNEESNGAGSR
jgi:MFS family permease